MSKVRELKVSKTSLLSYEGLGATSPWEDRGSRESYSILLSTAAGGSMRRPPGATPELAVGALEPEADHQCRKQEVTGLCCWGHGEDVLVGSSEPWSPPFFLPSSSAVCHQHLQHRRKLSVTPMGSETFPSLRHKGTDFLPQRADSTDKQGRLAASPRAFILRACKIHSRRSGNPGAHPQTRAFQSGPCTPRRTSQNIPCSEHLWELLAPFSGRVSLRKLVSRSMEHSQLLSLAGKPVLGF